MDKEVWMPVTKLRRFDRFYRVADTVNVKKGYYISSKGRLRFRGKVHKNKPEANGYIYDSLPSYEGKVYRFRRHQIVMQTFDFDGYKEGYSVDHVDRNPKNNHLKNLRWANLKTQNENKENVAYKYKKVMCINDKKQFNSCQEAEEYYGLTKNTVSIVARGVRKSIHGLSFVYV